MKLRFIPVFAIAAALAVAGCSSSSSSSASAVRPVTHPPSVSGTEVFTARETGQAVIGNGPPTYHLTFTGPVNTTGTFTPPGGNAAHQAGMFRTGAGIMVVSAVVSGNGPDGPPPQALGNCLYQFRIHATYTVNGAKSTGRFAGATGSGTALVVNRFYVKKLANGQCDMNQNDQPLAAGAVSTFYGSGPLVIKG